MRPAASTSTRSGGVAILALALTQLAACGEKAEPAGQVVAVVNGSEITTSELQAEAEATRTDFRSSENRNRLLEAVVQRHLLAAAARDRGLDKDPRVLGQKRRAEQHVLAQRFLLNANAAAAEADIREARTFILHNPKLFEERERLVLDRIGFSPARAVSEAEGASIKSLADAERLLQRKGVRYDRQSAAIDPADIPPDIATRLLALKDGEVLFAPQARGGMFLVITQRKPDPVPMPEQLARAQAILKRQKQQEGLRSAVENLRKTAKISYQKGYGPVGGAGGAKGQSKGAPPKGATP
jgi:EpsD family peptidyl-prolyl cis-trans isomerase